MKYPLTICFTTARKEPHLDWFVQSLLAQTIPPDDVTVLVVDYDAKERRKQGFPSWLNIVEPKPCVWQGEHRLTKDEWWAKSSYLNTGLILCQTPWFACVDDRSVLDPMWLQCVNDAMEGNYAVAGSYEKLYDVVVDKGQIVSATVPVGEDGFPHGKDPRSSGRRNVVKCQGDWFLGCTNALPLEWALNVNGWDESCDSLGLEDCIFGRMLAANKYEIRYDHRMKLWEDRSPGQIESFVQRTDKGISPNDKSHGLVKRTRKQLSATHDIYIRGLRERVQLGMPFPIPTTPTHDWWDNQPLSQFP